MSLRFFFCSAIINSRCSNVESRPAGSATSLIQFAWTCGACKYYSAWIFFFTVTSSFMSSFDTSYISALFLLGYGVSNMYLPSLSAVNVSLNSLFYIYNVETTALLAYVSFSECIGK